MSAYLPVSISFGRPSEPRIKTRIRQKLIGAIKNGHLKRDTLVEVEGRAGECKAEDEPLLLELFVAHEQARQAANVPEPTVAAPPASPDEARRVETPPRAPSDPAGGSQKPRPTTSRSKAAPRSAVDSGPTATTGAAPDPRPIASENSPGAANTEASGTDSGPSAVVRAVGVTFFVVLIGGVGAWMHFSNSEAPVADTIRQKSETFHAELDFSPRDEVNGKERKGLVIHRGEAVSVTRTNVAGWVELAQPAMGPSFAQLGALSKKAPPTFRREYKANTTFLLLHETAVFRAPGDTKPGVGKLTARTRVTVFGLVDNGMAEIVAGDGGVAYIPQNTFDFDGSIKAAEIRKERQAKAKAKAALAAKLLADQAKAAQDAANAAAQAKADAERKLAEEAQRQLDDAKAKLDGEIKGAGKRKLKDLEGRPTRKQIEAARPPRAGQRAGKAELACVFRSTAEVAHCDVKEDPPGLGFGESARSLVDGARWRWKPGRAPANGARVPLTFQWRELPEGRP